MEEITAKREVSTALGAIGSLGFKLKWSEHGRTGPSTDTSLLPNCHQFWILARTRDKLTRWRSSRIAADSLQRRAPELRGTKVAIEPGMPFDFFSLPGRNQFAFGLLGLTVTAAYLQATAMVHLVEAVLTVPNYSVASGLAVPKNSAIALGNPKSAKGILLRNVFDSLTGPIGDKPKLPDAPRSLADPLSATTCNDTKTLIVTESVDPTWSMAALQGPGEAVPRSRRLGDDVAGKQVAYIGYNPRYQRPSVWLVGGAELCQSLLFAPAVPPPDKSGVAHQRAVAEKPLSEREKLFRSVRAVPDVVDGQVVGVRLLGIRPDSLLGLLGLKNGDRLENINGFSLTSVEKALEAYVQLRTLDKLKVQVNRGGNPMTIEYKIL